MSNYKGCALGIQILLLRRANIRLTGKISYDQLRPRWWCATNNFSIESRIAIGFVIFTEIEIVIWIRMETVVGTNPNPNSNNNNNRLSAAALGAAAERRQMLKHIGDLKRNP